MPQARISGVQSLVSRMKRPATPGTASRAVGTAERCTRSSGRAGETSVRVRTSIRPQRRNPGGDRAAE